MVLKPLEFRDCTFDDPDFRQNLLEHENEIERTYREIKQLVREITDVIQATATLSRCQKQLAKHLSEFKFDVIGGSQTEDEIIITNSLKEFGRVLSDIEEERTKILENSMSQFVNPLESFRSDGIGGVKAEKKKFDKESSRYYQAQEKHLSMSCKKDENILREADADLQMQRRHFTQASLRYVKSIQEVHERKKFQFVETLWCFMSAWMRFYKISYDITKDFEPYMRDLQVRVQKVRDSFDNFRLEGEMLMNKIQKTLENPQNTVSQLTTGFLYLMEKKAFGTTWTKHYCAYDRNIKQLTLVPFSHTHGKPTGAAESLRIKSCVRKPNDTIDKRFCFDLTTDDRSIYTFQAPSDDERLRWMSAMDGKEPVYQQPGKSLKENEFITDLNDVGFRFVHNCIEAIERRGLSEQGLYRLAGVNSKANKLLYNALDPNDKTNFHDEFQWETRTITSALKTYLRSLREPLLTFRLHESLIKAAQKENKQDRLNDIHSLIASLPDPNRRMLEIIIRHLAKVAANCSKNLMTISNLGVCFGPTLLRPEEESVAALVDIKFCNIVVETLIEHWQKVFLSLPSSTPASEYAPLIKKLPATPKPVQNNLSAPNFLPRTDPKSNGISSSNSNPNLKPFMDKVVAVPWTPRDGPKATPPDSLSIKSSPTSTHSYNFEPAYYSTPLDIFHDNGLHEARDRGREHPLPEFGVYAQPDTSSGRVAMAVAKLTSAPNTHSSHLAAQFFPRHDNGPHSHSLLPPKAQRDDTSGSSISSVNSSRNNSPQTQQPPPQSLRTPERSMPPSPLTSNPPPKNASTANNRLSTVGDPASQILKNKPSLTATLSHPSKRRVRAKFSCHGEGSNELSFHANDVITAVRHSHEPGWLLGELRGRTGLLPANYVEDIPPEPDT